MSTETAYVPTPPRVASFMATSVFGVDHSTSEKTVLYPGLGTGRLYDAIHCFCTKGDDVPSTRSIRTAIGIVFQCTSE